MERLLFDDNGNTLQSTYTYIEHAFFENFKEVDIRKIPNIVRRQDEETLAALFASSARQIPELTGIPFDHILDCTMRISRFLMMSSEFQEIGNITNGDAEKHHVILEILHTINRIRKSHRAFFRAIIDKLLKD